MPERSKDWIQQAVKDIEAAEKLLNAGSFEWVCFIAQQAAEKAVKAVFQKLNATAWGHSVFDSLQALSPRISVTEEILNCARLLDRYYIPTRYPNSFQSGSPYQYFTGKDAEDAILCSRRILGFCESLLA